MSSSNICPGCGAVHIQAKKFCNVCGSAMQSGLSSQQHATGLRVPTGLLASNSLLNNRYRIVSSVGQGGMGAVYKTEDVSMGNRFIAIKELSQAGLTAQE